MHAETRTHKVRRAAKLKFGGCAWKGHTEIFSHAIFVWATNMNSAPWTGVDLSPLKRCCHNAFVFFPLLVRERERERGCHLMVRMHSSDTAGLCGGWGKGEVGCVACVCVIA